MRTLGRGTYYGNLNTDQHHGNTDHPGATPQAQGEDARPRAPGTGPEVHQGHKVKTHLKAGADDSLSPFDNRSDD